jgi:hypothetical protein
VYIERSLSANRTLRLHGWRSVIVIKAVDESPAVPLRELVVGTGGLAVYPAACRRWEVGWDRVEWGGGDGGEVGLFGGVWDGG